MNRSSRLRSLLVSLGCLLLGGGLVVLALHPPGNPDAGASSGPQGKRGVAVLERSAARDVVEKALAPEGEHLGRNNPAALARIKEQHARSADTLTLTAAWKHSLLEWDREHRLDLFLSRVGGLSRERLTIARKVPGALPLLLADNLPQTRQVLARHDVRAWRLFLAVNHFAYPEHLERLARTVQEDDSLLDVNEQAGLAFALMLVPPPVDTGSRVLPGFVKHVWKTMPPAEATAFLASYYRPAAELLDGGRSLTELTEAADRFRDLPELTRELSLDHPGTFRLVVEGTAGVEALKRCGPEAAELLHASYGEPGLKRPALVVLAGLGLKGLGVLERFRKHERFRELLRRADRELLDPPQPLVLDAVARIADAGSEAERQIESYLKAPDLPRSLAAKRVPPSPAEDILEYVPGYTVYRKGRSWADGDHLTPGDVGGAALDAVDTVLIVKGLITRAGRVVVTRLGRRLVVKEAIRSTGGRPGWDSLKERSVEETDTLERLEELRRKHGESLRSWPKEAREELRLLLARTPGLNAVLASERKELLQKLDLAAVLEQAAPVARRVGLTLWVAGDGPLAQVDRRYFLEQECSGVGGFARALLETGPYLQARREGPVPTPAVGPAIEQGPAEPVTQDPSATREPWRMAALGLAGLLVLLAIPPVRSLLGRTWRGSVTRKHVPFRE